MPKDIFPKASTFKGLQELDACITMIDGRAFSVAVLEKCHDYLKAASIPQLLKHYDERLLDQKKIVAALFTRGCVKEVIFLAKPSLPQVPTAQIDPAKVIIVVRKPKALSHFTLLPARDFPTIGYEAERKKTEVTTVSRLPGVVTRRGCVVVGAGAPTKL